MKYSASHKPIQCMMTNSTCYRQTRTMNIQGILWHSTGANNPNLKRYVQPSRNDPNYNELMKLLGDNPYNNDWNSIYIEVGLNAWVGKLADGSVAAVQTMPWNYRPWGCASGRNGSCNNGWIQFEICEDNLRNRDYFEKVYKEACELTAYLCRLYNIDPNGKTRMNGVNVPTILCHQDSYRLGLGSNHSDVYHWFKRYGKDMNSVRRDVSRLLGSTPDKPRPEPSDPVGEEKCPYRRPSGNVQRGHAGESVKWVQWHLIKLSYLAKNELDGMFGGKTEEAVKKYQKYEHLSVDGIVGANTKNSLYDDYNPRSLSEYEQCPYNMPKGVISNGASGNGVRWVQWCMVTLGYLPAHNYRGKTNIDGDFGKATDTAVRKFQKSRHLTIDGDVGPTTKAAIKNALTSYKVTIQTNMYVRRKPTFMAYTKVLLHKGEVYTIIGETKDNWGKLKSGAGYIDLKYTKRR